MASPGLAIVFALVVIAIVAWAIRRDIRLRKSGEVLPPVKSTSTSSFSELLQSIYLLICAVSWASIFVVSWIWCIANYGYLLGVGLGWLPSAITATVLCWIWPIVAIAALRYGDLLFK
jgi:hypothetical protein